MDQHHYTLVRISIITSLRGSWTRRLSSLINHYGYEYHRIVINAKINIIYEEKLLKIIQFYPRFPISCTRKEENFVWSPFLHDFLM